MMQTIAIPQFVNEPLSDFSDPEVSAEDKIQESLSLVRSTILKKKYPLIIGGREQFTEDVFKSENPAHINEIVGYISVARTEDAEQVIRIIEESESARDWTRRSFKGRAEYLKCAAQKFREKRFFFIALMMLETGKMASEADAEICEAIDFLEWYAAYAPFIEELNDKTLLNPSGERNSATYLPVGKPPICVSIQPWNFPIAISVGPAAAALVSGYAVLYKPAEQSSVIGYHIAKTFHEAGIPKDILHLLTGRGEEIGSYLVGHPAVNAIAFTGSKEVRQEIQFTVAKFNNTALMDMPYKDRHEKRVLALESGGKNAIIVDSDADIDEVVLGVSDSAFGFQGQKCSACSRLIIVDEEGTEGEVYRSVLSRLSERIISLPIGPPENFKNKIGPLIDKGAYEKFYYYMEIAQKEGSTICAQGIVPEALTGGYFVPPVILENVGINSRIAHEEVFGPLLCVFHATSFKEAVSLANNTEFGLTAGVYSRNPRNIEYAKEELNVGNIYINRKTTGAVVGRQPFGGFKMSGNSTKAGGWDYLFSFLLDRKNITENTMRRGIPLK